MSWWREVRWGLCKTFPDSEIRVLPRPRVGADALRIRLGPDVFLVDRKGILRGPRNDTFTEAYGNLLESIQDLERNESDPSMDF